MEWYKILTGFYTFVGLFLYNFIYDQLKKMKPHTTYNGGKAGNGTYQNIINHIPKCDTFIDAMVGNGEIFFNLNLRTLTVINDIDKSVIDRYNQASVPGIVVENKDYAGIIKKYDVATDTPSFVLGGSWRLFQQFFSLNSFFSLY